MVNSVAVQPRGLKVSFTFLPKGKKYIAHIYSEDDSVNTRTNVRHREPGSDSGFRF